MEVWGIDSDIKQALHDMADFIDIKLKVGTNQLLGTWPRNYGD